MIYENIVKATFKERPNRFIAKVILDGHEEICHVKNTGRCKELLTPDAEIYVQRCQNPLRKTGLDLISVVKDGLLINMDSQIPNKVFGEWAKKGNIYKNIEFMQSEKTHRDSRFDWYMEGDGAKAFIEVKGVTLERGGVAMFPDAPTQRGVKHLRGLIECVKEGYDAYIVFIIQFKGAACFIPNAETHPEFAQTLRLACESGVKIVALDCQVTQNSITADQEVEVNLNI